MDVKKEMVEDVAVLIPAGNLVASVTSSFNAQINKLAGNNRFIVLDMGCVTFMDSSGLDAVMAVNKLASGVGGIFVCAGLQDNIQKVFRITWADQKIPIAGSRADALQMIKHLREDQCRETADCQRYVK